MCECPKLVLEPNFASRDASPKKTKDCQGMEKTEGYRMDVNARKEQKLCKGSKRATRRKHCRPGPGYLQLKT